MEKIAANRERILPQPYDRTDPLNHRSSDVTASTMITAECAARRASCYPCQVDGREQYNSDASKGKRTRYAGLMKSRIFLRRTRQSSAIAASRR
jgi:hypothetical protein